MAFAVFPQHAKTLMKLMVEDVKRTNEKANFILCFICKVWHVFDYKLVMVLDFVVLFIIQGVLACVSFFSPTILCVF